MATTGWMVALSGGRTLCPSPGMAPGLTGEGLASKGSGLAMVYFISIMIYPLIYIVCKHPIPTRAVSFFSENVPGNGAGKWLWLLSLEELSRSCPFIANLTVQRRVWTKRSGVTLRGGVLSKNQASLHKSGTKRWTLLPDPSVLDPHFATYSPRTPRTR